MLESLFDVTSVREAFPDPLIYELTNCGARDSNLGPHTCKADALLLSSMCSEITYLQKL